MDIIPTIASILMTTTLASPEPANLDILKTATVSCGMQDPDLLTTRSDTDDQEALDVFDRIVGGTVANPDQYPWMVSIARRSGSVANADMTKPSKRNMTLVSGDRNLTLVDDAGLARLFYHICGGSLITKDWVMTAAHCLTGERPTADYNIRLGTLKLLDPFHVSMHPSKIIVHPKYDPDQYGYDIGLMKLATPITKFTSQINTVCLSARAEKPPAYTNCTVTGWGLLDENTTGLPKTLRQVDIKILPDAACSYILPSMICAGVVEGGKDSCMGDSGGPLVYAANTNGILRYYQAGIVSFGEGCARPNYPGVYADVGFLLDWIKGTIVAN